MRLQNWLFNTWHTAAKLHGFEEYSAPIIENASLYKRKNGEEIEDQLYSFLDKSNRPLALRPEMTPSLARLLLKKYKSMTFPLKWYSIPQCWRYEKMSKGRRREHFQWNLDIIGNESLEAELEIFQVLIFALKKFGLTEKDVVIKVKIPTYFFTYLYFIHFYFLLFSSTLVFFSMILCLSTPFHPINLSNILVSLTNLTRCLFQS